MAISLSVQNSSTSDKNLKLNRVAKSRINRISRVRSDLDKQYIEAETRSRAKFLGLKYIDLYGFPIDTNHLKFFTKSQCKDLHLGVFLIKNENILFLATPNPGHEKQIQILKELKQKDFKTKLYLCSELSFEKILQTYSFLVEPKIVSDDIVIDEKEMEKVEEEITLKELATKLHLVSVSEMVEIVLKSALQAKASDIHFEPEKDSYNLRFRLDGVLHTFVNLPVEMRPQIESRLKIVSGLKLNVDNIPQDGRFSFKAGKKEIDVRVSMLPSNYGYSIVMRLLGTENVLLEMTQLGFTGPAKEKVEKAIARPQGMILTTGPTGSGKTTTLYTFLKSLNNGEGKIITLEDPIEYKLSGISQTQIDAKSGYNFASGLRSILRQDPDVVMVGEIRDPETSDTAVQASLTGHLVLSTVHTNDAAGAIPRLMEMGVKGFLLADSLALVIGQRLVRKICPYCKKVEHLNDEQKSFIYENLKNLPDEWKVLLPRKAIFYTSSGCDKCNGLGYKGRVGCYEVLNMTDNLRNVLSSSYPSIMEVRRLAQQEGMITMLQDALIKATLGMTDLKEIQANIV